MPGQSTATAQQANAARQLPWRQWNDGFRSGDFGSGNIMVALLHQRPGQLAGQGRINASIYRKRRQREPHIRLSISVEACEWI
jgi:hypothetical protein